MRCSKCDADNRNTARFCDSCGASLPTAEAETFERTKRSPLTGERRHLTVLFCDLVGSTEIASSLDPEEWREMAAGYQRASASVVERFGGHVAKYLGDGSRTHLYTQLPKVYAGFSHGVVANL